MQILHRPLVALALGALAALLLALIGTRTSGAEIVAELSARADKAIAEVDGAPVRASFVSPNGWYTRHPILSGGEDLSEAKRDEVAKAVAAVPGVGGIQWIDGTALAESSTVAVDPLHCQDDVEALLQVRTIRFEEGSARIDAASRELIDEVARALQPCLGSIIAITGHTDSSGSEPRNMALSEERALAVRRSLINRGIPGNGVRAKGMGSSEPIEGLDPTDPANRRIEFSVVATVPIVPSPVDTPGPR